MMTSTPAEVCAAYLVSVVGSNVVRPANLSATNFPVTTGAMPDLNDRWVSIKELTPFSEGKYHGCQSDPDAVGESVIKPVLQILVRARDYDDADYQIRKISCILSPVHLATVNTKESESVLLHACCVEQQPAFLMQEEKNRRQVFVMTVKLSISEV